MSIFPLPTHCSADGPSRAGGAEVSPWRTPRTASIGNETIPSFCLARNTVYRTLVL